ncbi:MAG: LysE family translocator [Pseudomonadales bacterium]|nr:LysE family translocator [Pseudomonadales bacterium]
MELLTFILISLGVIVIPGPNVLVIISTSLTEGKRRGLQVVSGVMCAMRLQMLVAGFGTAWFVNVLTEGLFWLKWAGVMYLIYLGVMQFMNVRGESDEEGMTREGDNQAGKNEEGNGVTGVSSFRRGFVVSLTNPKTILFFSAFLPQFTVGEGSYLLQIGLLSAIFWLLAFASDACFALASGHVSDWIKGQRMMRVFGYCSGVMYLGAGVMLAVMRRT